MKLYCLICCYFYLPLALSAPGTYRSAGDFSQFLEVVRREAVSGWVQSYAMSEHQEKLVQDSKGWLSLSAGVVGNLRNVSRHGDIMVQMDRDGSTRASVNIYYDALEYAFDFSTDSDAFPPASGCIYGQMEGMLGIAGIRADTSNASAVKASIEGLKFLGIGAQVTDEVSMESLSSRFVQYAIETVGNMLRTEALPLIESQLTSLMNSSLENSVFDMRAICPVSSTTKRTVLPQTNGRTAVNRHPPARPSRTSQDPERAALGKMTVHFAPSHSWSSISSRAEMLCTLSRSSSRRTSRPVASQNYQTVNVSSCATDTVTGSFNNLFDYTLTSTRSQFLSQHLDPLRLPDKDEQLYEITDGMVQLKGGVVYGLDSLSIAPGVTVTRNGSTAAVTARVCFSDISYSFDFSTDGDQFPNVLGLIHGNISLLCGQIEADADVTNPRAVTASLVQVKMSPNMDDFHVSVSYNKTNVEGDLAGEVFDAVVNDFKVNISQKLEDMTSGVLRRALTRIRVDMSTYFDPNTTTTTTSTSTSTSTTTNIASTTTESGSTVVSSTTSDSPSTTKPSTANTSLSTTQSSTANTTPSTTQSSNTSSTTNAQTSAASPSTSESSNSNSSATTQTPNSSAALNVLQVWTAIITANIVQMITRHAFC